MTARLTDRLVGQRLLFYVLILLYIIGLAVGGSTCRGAAILVTIVPMILVSAVVVEAAIEGDYYTAISGIIMMILLVLAKTVA